MPITITKNKMNIKPNGAQDYVSFNSISDTSYQETINRVQTMAEQSQALLDTIKNSGISQITISNNIKNIIAEPFDNNQTYFKGDYVLINEDLNNDNIRLYQFKENYIPNESITIADIISEVTITDELKQLFNDCFVTNTNDLEYFTISKNTIQTAITELSEINTDSSSEPNYVPFQQMPNLKFYKLKFPSNDNTNTNNYNVQIMGWTSGYKKYFSNPNRISTIETSSNRRVIYFQAPENIKLAISNYFGNAIHVMITDELPTALNTQINSSLYTNFVSQFEPDNYSDVDGTNIPALAGVTLIHKLDLSHAYTVHTGQYVLLYSQADFNIYIAPTASTSISINNNIDLNDTMTRSVQSIISKIIAPEYQAQ